MNDRVPPGGPAAHGAADADKNALIDETARRQAGALPAHLAGLTPREVAEEALRLPSRQRLEVLLHAPAPMRAVRALPDFEAYLTVREVGPVDALPMLALASRSQLQHLVDLEAWRHDDFDGERTGAWVALLAEAGEATLSRFLRTADNELLALLFTRWLRVIPVEMDEDPVRGGSGLTEAGDERGFVSPDGGYLLRPLTAEHMAPARRFAEALFTADQALYFQVVEAAGLEVPTELEEQALRWRNSRLEEHGFPPWDEALRVFDPPRSDSAHPEPPAEDDPDALGAPRTALRVLRDDRLVVPALEGLDSAKRDRALHELSSLANHLLVADSADFGNPEAHRSALRRAGAYLGLALAARGVTTPEGAARALVETPVVELFREGFAAAADLKARAEQLVRTGWPSAHPRALELLDPPFEPRLRALLQPRPLYVPIEAASLPNDPAAIVARRDFRTPEEVGETRLAVEMAETLGAVFVHKLGLDPAAVLALEATRSTGAPRFSTLLLTALAWNATRDEVRASPLPAAVLSDFLRTVVSRRTADPSALGRALDRLLGRLAAEAKLDARETARLRKFGLACLEVLKEECGGLDPGLPPDPKAVSCLLLEDHHE